MEIHNFYYKNTVLLWSGVVFSALLIPLLFILSVHNADAKVDTPSNKASVNQSTFRAYNSSSTATPGSPLAASNQAATLSDVGDPFRLRVGLTNTDKPYITPAIKSMAITAYNSCALANDDWVYCWADNTDGGLGTGDDYVAEWMSAPMPIANGDIPTGATIKSLHASSTGNSICVIATNDWAYCWGGNDTGQLGDGTTTKRNKPTAIIRGAIPVGATIKSVAISEVHACAIASDDRTYCWGENESGQLGNNSTTNSNSPVAVSRGAMPSSQTVKKVSVGAGSSCAIATDDKAYCWGGNWDGRLANGNNTDSSVPVAVARGNMPNGFTIKDISVGYLSMCVIANDNKGYCAGYNNGQLGSTATTNSNTPRAIAQGAMPSAMTLKSISMGTNHACAIGTNDRAYCWGSNEYKQLGNNSTADSKIPVAVSQGDLPSGQSTSSVVAAHSHTCTLSTADTWAYCWGYGINLRLGNGMDENKGVPVKILAGAMSHGIDTSPGGPIASGIGASCVVASDEWVY